MRLTHLFLFCLLVLSGTTALAKTIRISHDKPIQEQLREPGVKYVIRDLYDLDGDTLYLPSNSIICFNRKGSFVNGTIVGYNTALQRTKRNVFKNCIIRGKWEANYSYSSMFDEDMDAVTLLRNLSCLSSNIVLAANRNYVIDSNEIDLDIESLTAAGKEKPIVQFHTSNPNLEGLKLYGKNVVIKGIRFTDDYDETGNFYNCENDVTIGNMIAIRSRDNIVQSLIIDECEFSGSTSSSYVASSQTRNCLVNNCSFSGYTGDHAVYCSMRIESFIVQKCQISDIVHTRGLFKIRGSKTIREFTIKDVNSRNLNGYMAIVSLEETPDCNVLFDHIIVTRDYLKDVVFYGFCINDDTNVKSITGYNANQITVSNCTFEYGYNGNPVIYQGSGKDVRAKISKFLNTYANQSNFAGGCVDHLIVDNCTFEDCYNTVGIVPIAEHINISKTRIINKTEKTPRHLFLINYGTDFVKSITMNNVDIDVEVQDLVGINMGTALSLSLDKCKVSSVKRSIVYYPASCSIKYNKKSCVIDLKNGDEVFKYSN